MLKYLVKTCKKFANECESAFSCFVPSLLFASFLPNRLPAFLTLLFIILCVWWSIRGKILHFLFLSLNEYNKVKCAKLTTLFACGWIQKFDMKMFVKLFVFFTFKFCFHKLLLVGHVGEFYLRAVEIIWVNTHKYLAEVIVTLNTSS